MITGKAVAFGAAALAAVLLLFRSKKASAAPSPDPAPIPTPTPTPGPSVPDCPSWLPSQVKDVQARLNYLGLGPLGVDGVQGPKTKAAVLSYQKKTGLAETGCIDNPTYNQIIEIVLPSAPPPAEEFVDGNGRSWEVQNVATGNWRGVYVDTPIAEYGGTPTVIYGYTRNEVVTKINNFAATHPL